MQSPEMPFSVLRAIPVLSLRSQGAQEPGPSLSEALIVAFEILSNGNRHFCYARYIE